MSTDDDNQMTISKRFSSQASECDLSTENENFLHRLPKMYFDKFFITVASDSIINKDHKRIEIPICFGVPMVMLREKHEQELLNYGTSFIENEIPPSKILIDSLVDKIQLNCTSIEDIKIILNRTKCIVIFYVILELLHRLPFVLFPLTHKTAQISSRISLLQSAREYDFTISSQLYDNIAKYYNEHGQDELTRYHRSTKQTDEIIHSVVQKYYNCEELGPKKLIKLYNKFNKSIYHDIHIIPDILQRNLIRFIIRNFIFLLRRYNLNCLRKLKQHRNESWNVIAITTTPHVVEYSINKLASLIGPLLISQPSIPEYYANVEIQVMVNIFASNMDRLWLNGQKPQDMIISMEPSYCHPNCICGRGLNVISASAAMNKTGSL